MQVMETYSKEKSQPNLITHISVEAASESDTNALLPAIADATQRGLAPTELLADTLYGSDDNVEKAKALGITVIAPVMGAKENVILLADFTFSDSDHMTACPEQQAPIRTKIGKNGGTTASFDKALCDSHITKSKTCDDGFLDITGPFNDAQGLGIAQESLCRVTTGAFRLINSDCRI